MGKSVIDYIAVNHNVLSYCTYFEVVTMTDGLDKYQLYTLISENSLLIDHSLLIAHVSCILISTGSVHAVEHNINAFPRTRYNKSNMSSQLWKEWIYRII